MKKRNKKALRQDILNSVFKLTYDRLTKQSESLKFYIERWHGSNGGIEGWFKVELVAAIPSDVIKITTGSATRGKSTGKRYPDLQFKKKGFEPIDVELKASTNWSLAHGKSLQHYDGWVLFFLCGVPSNSLDDKRQVLAEKRYPFKVDYVCEAVKCTDNKSIDFLFGFLDIGGSKHGITHNI